VTNRKEWAGHPGKGGVASPKSERASGEGVANRAVGGASGEGRG